MRDVIKLAGAITAMLVLLMLCGCATLHDGDTFVGSWELVETSGDESALSPDYVREMRDLGMIIQLTLEEDGTLIIDQYGEISTGTWQATSTDEGLATLDNNVALMRLDGDRLIMGDEASSMTFKRQGNTD
ncbi:hypothetical protein [Adlercreutzia sp. ZJ138]|uniref:hypothetical protein n=1 Tax=Adlercreutzia sp. ZJ138 TaxID=2709405 RepID=UPI0013ECDB66|nr:hypothetical protein [Adlercreutzia sp. ZJ138]